MPAAEQRVSERGTTVDREAVLCPHRLDIDDEVFAVLADHSEPLVDTPNTVLRRLLGIDQATSRPAPIRRKRRAALGTLLPASEYEIPILRYLEKCGGWAPAREAIEAIGRALDGRLTEADRQPLKSGRIRWEERAGMVRLRLVQRGELAKNSPRAAWKISDQGRERLRSEDGRQETGYAGAEDYHPDGRVVLQGGGESLGSTPTEHPAALQDDTARQAGR